jgi:hypothetical protein
MFRFGRELKVFLDTEPGRVIAWGSLQTEAQICNSRKKPI